MWGNIIPLTYEHLHQPVRSPHVRRVKQMKGFSVARDPTDKVRGSLCIGGRRHQRWKGTCWVPQPLSQREWRAEDVRQGEEEGAMPQEAEIERATNGKKHGLNLRSQTAPLCRMGSAIPKEGLTQSQRRSLAVISKRAAAKFEHLSDFTVASVTLRG